MTSPPRPYTPTSFVDGEAMNPVKWYARVSRVINYLLALFGTGPQVRFFAVVDTAQSLTANVNISFDTIGTIIEDTDSAWNAATDVWTCPSAGTYLFSLGLKCGSTPQTPTPILIKNGSNYIVSRTPPSQAGIGEGIGGYLRLAVGDTVSARTGSTFTTVAGAAHNNYFQLAQISYN